MKRFPSRRWVWFFLILALLSAGAIVVPIVYNLSIQLRPEQVLDARLRWHTHAPSDYDLEYQVRTTHTEGEEVDQYWLQVRAGRAALVARDDQLIFADPSLALAAGAGFLALPFENPERYGMASLLDEVEDGLERDYFTGKRIYFAMAQFDPKDGHPYHYVRRKLGTRERTEWNVKLTPVP